MDNECIKAAIGLTVDVLVFDNHLSICLRGYKKSRTSCSSPSSNPKIQRENRFFRHIVFGESINTASSCVTERSTELGATTLRH